MYKNLMWFILFSFVINFFDVVQAVQGQEFFDNEVTIVPPTSGKIVGQERQNLTAEEQRVLDIIFKSYNKKETFFDHIVQKIQDGKMAISKPIFTKICFGIHNVIFDEDSNVTDEDIRLLILYCPNIESIYLNSCSRITGRSLALLQNLKKLEKLEICGGRQFTDDDIASLGRLSMLKRLDLQYFENLTDLSLQHIATFLNLEELGVYRNVHITDAGVAHVAKLAKLKKLFLSGCSKLTDRSLQDLSVLENLQNLSLGDCKKITDDGLWYVRRFKNLESVNLSGCELVTDQGIESLQYCKKLKSVNLLDCKKVSDGALKFLANLVELQELILNHTAVTNAGIKHLVPLKHLSELSIAGCDITNFVFSSIVKMKNLTDLNVAACNKITDKGFIKLSALKKLKFIRINEDSKVTYVCKNRVKAALPEVMIW